MLARFSLLCARLSPQTTATLTTLSTRRVVFNKHGDPNDVTVLVSQELPVPDSPPSLGSKEPLAVVKWLAAPINPADINQIQGIYPSQPPSLPATGGNEGCGVVEAIIGPTSNHGGVKLEVGQRVVPTYPSIGTWCTHGIYPFSRLYPIDSWMGVVESATFYVNPPTAYRMLRDIVDLEAVKCKGKERPVVVQNGANSSVGRLVIQIAKLFGYATINLVRDRPELSQLKGELRRLGADYVLTEEEFLKATKAWELPKAQLGLNCVGGKSSLLLCRALGDGACLVSYGAMSKQPLQVPTGSLIFNDVSCRGFWITSWYDREGNPSPNRDAMYRQLAEWFLSGELVAPKMEKRRIDEYKEALTAATSEKQGERKQLFVFE